jgi:hypothetical protein
MVLFIGGFIVKHVFLNVIAQPILNLNDQPHRLSAVNTWRREDYGENR